MLVFDGEILKVCALGMAKEVNYSGYYRRCGVDSTDDENRDQTSTVINKRTIDIFASVCTVTVSVQPISTGISSILAYRFGFRFSHHIINFLVQMLRFHP